MEGDRREPPPDGGTDGKREPTCKYVLTYDVTDTSADPEENWLLEWCLETVSDPGVTRIDVERFDGDAPERLIVYLDADPNDCRSLPLRRRLADGLAERVDTRAVTCRPIANDESTVPTYEPTQAKRDRLVEVSG